MKHGERFDILTLWFQIFKKVSFTLHTEHFMEFHCLEQQNSRKCLVSNVKLTIFYLSQFFVLKTYVSLIKYDFLSFLYQWYCYHQRLQKLCRVSFLFTGVWNILHENEKYFRNVSWKGTSKKLSKDSNFFFKFSELFSIRF